MPCIGQPDALDLVVDVDAVDSLKIAQGGASFGSSEGMYLFVGDVLLGAPNDFSEYYRRKGVDLRGRTAVTLLPSFSWVDRQGFPDLITFWKSLKFIMDSSSDWMLICERDCEQCDLQTLSYGSKIVATTQ